MRGAALACALVAAVSSGNDQSDPLAPRSKGSPTAPVTVYEMSDFQCPYCRDFALNTMPILERDYVATGKVRFVFVNLPLSRLHANAVAAAAAAMCAARGKKFWPMHDLLFRHQDRWAGLKDPASYFATLGDSAGLDRAKLARCLTSRQTEAEVRADSVRAAKAGASSTPTFYIEGGLLEGAAPVEVFRTVLDSIHRAKTAARPPPPPAP
jgi:protein-disulfide isomerase